MGNGFSGGGWAGDGCVGDAPGAGVDQLQRVAGARRVQGMGVLQGRGACRGWVGRGWVRRSVCWGRSRPTTVCYRWEGGWVSAECVGRRCVGRRCVGTRHRGRGRSWSWAECVGSGCVAGNGWNHLTPSNHLFPPHPPHLLTPCTPHPALPDHTSPPPQPCHSCCGARLPPMPTSGRWCWASRTGSRSGCTVPCTALTWTTLRPTCPHGRASLPGVCLEGGKGFRAELPGVWRGSGKCL